MCIRDRPGRIAHIDLRTGMQAVEMRDMAVMDFRRIHVPVLLPFHQLPGTTNTIGRQFFAQRGKLRGEILLHAQ